MMNSSRWLIVFALPAVGCGGSSTSGHEVRADGHVTVIDDVDASAVSSPDSTGDASAPPDEKEAAVQDSTGRSEDTEPGNDGDSKEGTESSVASDEPALNEPDAEPAVAVGGPLASEDAGTTVSMADEVFEDADPGCEAVPLALEGVSFVFDEARAASASSDSLNFFDLPWPELLRGNDALLSFPNPVAAGGCSLGGGGGLVGAVLGAVAPSEQRAYLAELIATNERGASTSGASYLQFDGALSTALPEPEDTLDAASPVLLVNVDAASEAFGRLTPVSSRTYIDSHYLPPNTLAVLPVPGFPLLPNTRYATVVRRSLGGTDGQPLGSSESFESLKATGRCSVRQEAYAEAFDALFSELGIARAEVAAMTVFETGEPQAALDTVTSAISGLAAADLADFTIEQSSEEAAGYTLFAGSFKTPLQQYGTPPYLPQIDVALTGDVDITLDAADPAGAFLTATPFSGSPDALDSARSERIGFMLALPALNSDTAQALDVVVFAPGTGGSVISPFVAGIVDDLTAAGLAVFVADPVIHAQRAHSENIDANLMSILALSDQLTGTDYQAELVGVAESGDLFFNPLNLKAARGNSLQGAVDYIWQAKLLSELELSLDRGAGSSTVTFATVSFFGHSQGASLGPLLAGSDVLSASVLSAPGAHVPSVLLYKTQPADRLTLSGMLRQVVCDSEAEPLDEHHPFMSLVAHWFDPIDGVNHIDSWVAADTGSPRSTFVLLGEQDNYSPRQGNHALVTAGHLPQAAPALSSVLGLSLLAKQYPAGGFDAASSPLSRNLGSATVGFRQYTDATCRDDHFVYTCVDRARADWATFLAGAPAGGALIP